MAGGASWSLRQRFRKAAALMNPVVEAALCQNPIDKPRLMLIGRNGRTRQTVEWRPSIRQSDAARFKRRFMALSHPIKHHFVICCRVSFDLSQCRRNRQMFEPTRPQDDPCIATMTSLPDSRGSIRSTPCMFSLRLRTKSASFDTHSSCRHPADPQKPRHPIAP
jgi:hypothetical protein